MSSPLSPEDFYASVAGIVGKYGGVLGSKAGGKHNKGSKHYSGQAVDIPLGEWRNIPLEKQNAMLAALQADPRFKVLDERQRPKGQAVWGGKHLHVQLANIGQPAAPVVAQVAPPQDTMERFVPTAAPAPQELPEFNQPRSSLLSQLDRLQRPGPVREMGEPQGVPFQAAPLALVESGAGTWRQREQAPLRERLQRMMARREAMG